MRSLLSIKVEERKVKAVIGRWSILCIQETRQPPCSYLEMVSQDSCKSSQAPQWNENSREGPSTIRVHLKQSLINLMLEILLRDTIGVTNLRNIKVTFAQFSTPDLHWIKTVWLIDISCGRVVGDFWPSHQSNLTRNGGCYVKISQFV